MLTRTQVCGRGFSVLAFIAVIALLMGSFTTPAFSQSNSSSTSAVPDRVKLPIDDSNIVLTSSRNVHPFATAQNDMGRVSDELPMEKIILLLMRSPEQKAALDAMVDELHNRRSPLYHKWLTPEQIGRTYGPSDDDIAAISGWLQSHGFTVDEVPAGRTHIIFSGTAGQIRETFHTEIHNYLVNGQMHVANSSEPQIPAALSQVVQGFRSLHDFIPQPAMRNSGVFKRDAKTGKWYPEPGQHMDPRAVDITYGSGTSEAWLVGPQDWYTIYGENPLLSSGITGSGQTIAVIEETDINHTDVTTFRSQFNLPAYPGTANNTQGGVNYLQGAGGTCTDPGVLTNGEEPEADLDVQWAGVTAPAATIDFVSCKTTSSTAGIDLAASYVVNSLSSTVSSMSLSYGVCETELTGTGSLGIYQADSYYNKLWEQAAAQGQTAVVSSGDSGSEGCDQNVDVGTTASTETHGTQVSGMESTPYNVSAGGTDFSDTFNNLNSTYWKGDTTTAPYESALSYVPETPWGSYCANPLTLADFNNAGEDSGYSLPELCQSLHTSNAVYTDVVGGSGGPSNCATGTPATAGLVGGSCAGYAKPSWQSAYGVPADGVRDVPDLSFFASSGWWSHYLVYCDSAVKACNYSNTTDGEDLGAGGTSFVAPAINGLIALVNQKTGSWQGQADYTLYAMAANEYGASGSGGNTSNLNSCNANNGNAIGGSCVFYDIGPTNNNAGGGTVAVGITQPCNTVAGTTTQTPCYKSTYTYGVSSTSNTTEINAWSATAGYDYATGIGSANITNLVNNWNSYGASFATTTSLSANPLTLTSSTQSTTLTATVATTGRGGISAASGSVQFYIGSTSGTSLGSGILISNCTGSAPNVVCSGTATLSVLATQLQSGQNSIIAYFPGDGANDAASTSNTVTVTVQTQTNSTTTVSSSLNPSTYGQPVSFTATVTGNSPTGTVQFNIDGSAFGSPVTLVSGSATSSSINTLAVGTHMVTAVYSGDGNNSGSTGSLSGGQVVQTAGAGTITVGSSLNPSTYGQSVTFTATIPGQYNFIKRNGRARSQDVTGSVTWSDSNGPLTCTETGTSTTPVTAGNPGTATCTTATLPVNPSDTITANYSGDSNHSAGSGSTSQTISAAGSNVSVMSSLNPSTYGQSVTFTATISGANGLVKRNGVKSQTVTGSVTWSDSNGPLTCTETGTSTTPVTAGNPGTATCTTATLAVNPSDTITGNYSGDSNHSAGSGSTSQTINAAGSNVSVMSSLNPSAYGQAVTFTATINGTNGLVKRNGVRSQTVTGSVTWSDSNGPLTCQETGTSTTPVTAGNPGTATCTTATLPLNPSDTITANYSGDGNHSAGSGTVSQEIDAANSNVSVASSLNPSGYGVSVTFTATISGANGLLRRNNKAKSQDVSGTVTWSDNTGCGTTNVTSGNPGTATCTTSSLPVGSDTVAANYSGDANHNAGSGSVSQQVNGGVATAINVTNVAPSSEPYGQNALITITAVLSWTGNGTAPTAANVTIGGNSPSGYGPTSCGTPSGDTITCTALYTQTGADNVGSYNETATFSGDANYASSTSPQTNNFAVTQATSNTAVSSGQNPSNYQQSVTFTATITGQFGEVKVGVTRKGQIVKPQDIGGSVTWSSNTGCGTTPVSSGVATCTTSSLPGGNDAISGTYSGDSNHTGSTGSLSGGQTVNPIGQTITFTTNPPSSATYNTSFPVAATASSGLTVAFTASGVCSVVDNGNGSASYTMTSGTGSCSVIANQAGNNDYSAAPAVSKSVTAKQASQTITFTTPPPSTAGYETQFTVAATASSGLPVLYNASGVCTDSNTATYTITSPSGICIVIAAQPGNSNYAAAPELTPQLNATKGTPVITWNPNPASISYGAALGSGQLDATATNGVGAAVAGTFKYTPAAGKIFPAGTQTLSVTFTPTSKVDYNTVKATASLQVTQDATTTTVTSQDQTVKLSNTGTAKATIDFNVSSYKPTGSATVTASTGETCTGAVGPVTGNGYCKLTFTTAGTRSITASYPGDANHTGSNSDSQTPQITVTVTQ
jgi:hypothetical protein